MEQWLVIGVSGVTCSGKTTLAQSLYRHLKEQSGSEIKAGIELNRVEMLNQDSYFRQVDDRNHQLIEKLNHLNWEIIESIDMNKMVNDIMEILGDKFVLYNTRSSGLLSSQHRDSLFQNNYASNHQHLKQRPFRSNDMMMQDDHQSNFTKIVRHNNLLNILIIEGFLIFNHPVTLDLCNVKYHLHLPYEVCYERRIRRTYDRPDVPCYFEMVVWPAYEKHLREFKDRKEVTFLNGEVSPEKCFQFVLKSLIDEL